MFDFVFKEEDRLTKEEKQLLTQLLVPLFSFSYHFSQSYNKNKQLYYSSKPRWQLLLYHGKELVGSLSIVKRHLPKPFPVLVGGIGNLGIKENHQKKGLSLLMLKKTNEFMKKNGMQLSLLFCVEKLKGLNIKAGNQKENPTFARRGLANAVRTFKSLIHLLLWDYNS
ncbi:MAG: GNAT family N-acetyltransferase [Patescibacteria group bacterium]|nr:GNAT family N-acetyltransferase [Patescibacteria group bacterium]